MYLIPKLEKKWAPLLDSDKLPKIKDAYRRAVTGVVLENCEQVFEAEGGGELVKGQFLKEAAAANASAGFPTGNTNLKGPEPVLIPMLRRALPQMIAFDVVGVQPLNGPVGLIFALKAKATSQGGSEILFNEADTRFSTNDPSAAGAGYTATTPVPQADADAYKPLGAMATADGEALGTGSPAAEFSQVAFSIDKVTVTAKTRALKAEYTRELQQDMMASHGLDARAELANILSQEILFEINREVIRTIYNNAKTGAQHNVTSAGIFDLDTDSDGRWMIERFQGLRFQIDREANAILLDARRGRGNFVLASADVCSALSAAKFLNSDNAANDLYTNDGVQGTFMGTLNGGMKVFLDPYVPVSATNYFVVGYKGASAWDAGLFYCPYVPLQMMEAVGPNDFQPRIAYKTRYGLVSNPYANAAGNGALTYNANKYFRRVQVDNLM